MSDHEPGRTAREVRVDDPNLSPEANRALTDDLQKAVGAKEVRVPEGTPDHRRDVAGADPGRGLTPDESRNRLLLAITFVTAVVVGAILALVTGSWWLLLVPIAVHAVGAVLVSALVVQMSTQTEQPDPRTARALEDEGVASPDMAFNNLVEELDAQDDRAHGVTEVVGTGDNVQRGADDPVGHRTAMTPSQDPTQPAGGKSALMAMEWVPVIVLVLFSLILAIANGGRWWVVPAVVVPMCAAWMAYQQRAFRRERSDRADQAHLGGRAKGDSRTAANRTAVITAASVIAIVAVTAVAILLVV